MDDPEINRVSTPARIVATLRELIGALDRRTPRSERTSEIRIAREAAMLRREAVRRIEELKYAAEDHDDLYNQELGEAIMSDDGGPTPRSRSEARRDRSA